jgi:DNA sulfur modification protein DndC
VIKLDKSKISYSHVTELEDRAQQGLRVLARVSETRVALKYVLEKGYDHWIVTFSGGKDSTATVVTSLETAMEDPRFLRRIDVVYADTQLEIPSIRQYALSFLNHLCQFSRLEELPLHCHTVLPPMESRFWVCLLGKGYPPPHQRFRWCTHRLKIKPVEDKLKCFVQPDRTVIITGVRFGESRNRDKSLSMSCRRGGECGQGLWFQYSNRLKAGYLAPLIDWNDCDVWDYLLLVAPLLGYPTAELDNVYNGRETRFGCWMCTVVKQDRAMEKTIARPEWSHLAPLAEFRKYVWELTRSIDTRRLRPEGQPGRLKHRVRKELLKRLTEVQAEVGIEVIGNDDIHAIKHIWRKEGHNE